MKASTLLRGDGQINVRQSTPCTMTTTSVTETSSIRKKNFSLLPLQRLMEAPLSAASYRHRDSGRIERQSQNDLRRNDMRRAITSNYKKVPDSNARDRGDA